MQPLISRKEARRLGLKRYYTGMKCSRKHLSERFTSNATCRVCSRLDARKCLILKAYRKSLTAHPPESLTSLSPSGE